MMFKLKTQNSKLKVATQNAKLLVLSFSFALYALRFTLICYAQAQNATESDQQIDDFSLSGYGERGRKNWDLSGKSADIFTEIVKLKSVTGNLYGEQEDIKLTADAGDFDKTDGKVHLERNVVITTTAGTRLTTDSLDWDRKNQLVTTKDKVNIQRENMITTGTGAIGRMGLKQVSLQKDVTVDILGQAKEGGLPNPKDKTVITCDGSLEIDYEKNIAIFNDNVRVKRPDSDIYSDKMDIYFIAAGNEEKSKDTKESGAGAFMGNKIDRIIARGNVKVVRGENTSYSEEATYTASDKKLILTGRPKLIIYSSGGLDASFGN
jgi:LPS export ABC transporter protein LptC